MSLLPSAWITGECGLELSHHAQLERRADHDLPPAPGAAWCSELALDPANQPLVAPLLAALAELTHPLPEFVQRVHHAPAGERNPPPDLEPALAHHARDRTIRRALALKAL